MVTAVAWAATLTVLAGCATCAYAILTRGHTGGNGRLGCLRRTTAHRVTRGALRAAIAVLSVRAVRAAILRARWAWRCRKPPARSEGTPLNRADYLTFAGLAESFQHPAAPTERSRT